MPGIDGLRGLAVLAVVIYHFFGDVLPGGYLGVDVFFVLSGFLITSLLLRDLVTRGKVRLKNFWMRRIRRIMPAVDRAFFRDQYNAQRVLGALGTAAREQVEERPAYEYEMPADEPMVGSV